MLMLSPPSLEGVVAPPTWSLGQFRLRPLRSSDAPAWHAYLSDPLVIEHTSFPVLSPSAVEAMVTGALDGYEHAASCRWALADANDGLVGTAASPPGRCLTRTLNWCMTSARPSGA